MFSVFTPGLSQGFSGHQHASRRTQMLRPEWQSQKNTDELNLSGKLHCQTLHRPSSTLRTFCQIQQVTLRPREFQYSEWTVWQLKTRLYGHRICTQIMASLLHSSHGQASCCSDQVSGSNGVSCDLIIFQSSDRQRPPDVISGRAHVEARQSPYST